MAKRIHRAKIDDDQFVVRSGEFLARVTPVLEQHRTNILRGLLGLAVLALVVFFVVQSMQKSAERKQAAFDAALAPSAPDQAKSEKDHAAEMKTKLETFLKDYPGGETAAWAHFRLAEALATLGENDAAVEHYRTFLKDGSKESASLGRLGLANALLKAGKSSDAMKELEALKSDGWSSDAVELEIASAKLHTDRAAGIAALKALADKPNSPVAQSAKQRLQVHAPQPDATLLIKGVPDPADQAAAESAEPPALEADTTIEATDSAKPATAAPKPQPAPSELPRPATSDEPTAASGAAASGAAAGESAPASPQAVVSPVP